MSTLNLAIGTASALVIAGVVATKLSARLGVPVLLLFLGLGMLAGSEGPGGIEFDNAELSQSLGIIALAVILFAGGLDTSWDDVRPVLGRAAMLSTVGVVVSAVVVGVFAAWILDVPPAVGLLVGAIVSSTDAAAVFGVLRTRSIGLRDRLRPLLELESGSNDPMAVFLTIAFIQFVVEPETTVVGLVPLFVAQMVIGAIVGVLGGRGIVAVLNRIRLDTDGLYPVLLLALGGAVYAIAALANGSGFLAVYLAGLVAARYHFVHKRSLMRFFDGAAWFAQISMFIALGLLVFPSDLPGVAPEGLLVAAVLIFVARPVAVMVSLLPLRVPVREQAFVAWVGLRGAAPVILATFPLTEGIGDADLIFDVVFFVVLTSVLVQGTSLSAVARRLQVTEPTSEPTVWPIEVADPTADGAQLYELVVGSASVAAGRAVVDLGIPRGTIIVLVERQGAFAVPTGSTEFEAGDKVLVLTTPDGVGHLRELFESTSAP